MWHVKKKKKINENSRREETQHRAWRAKLKLPSPHQHVSQWNIYSYKSCDPKCKQKTASILLVLLMLTG